MKHNKRSQVLGMACAMLVSLPAHATFTYIADEYYGADDHGYGDVIGDAASFGIGGMYVERSGSLLTVRIHTSFAGRGGDGLFSDYTRDIDGDGVGEGIGYGDLFLGTGWNPDTSAANYLNDNYLTGTSWEYAFSVDGRFSDAVASGSSRTGALYGLAGDGSDTLLSDYYLSGGAKTAIWRNGQEVAVDTAGKAAVGGGDWVVDTGVNEIIFSIDVSGTSLASSNSIALHWGMTCGNDTIEGEWKAVPAPSILLLLGSGLLGLAGFARRRG